MRRGIGGFTKREKHLDGRVSVSLFAMGCDSGGERTRIFSSTFKLPAPQLGGSR